MRNEYPYEVFAPEDTLLSVLINTPFAGIPNLSFHKQKKYDMLCKAIQITSNSSLEL